MELKVTRMHGGKPWMTEFDNKFVRAAGRAIERGFGKAPVFNREGGSIPVVATFQRGAWASERAVRRRAARRERARAGREAGSRQLPQRHHRVGVSVRGDREHDELRSGSLRFAPRSNYPTIQLPTRSRCFPPLVRCAAPGGGGLAPVSGGCLPARA